MEQPYNVSVDADRFWGRVVKGSGCWEWDGAHLYRPDGSRSYGSLSWKGRQTGAHRVAWELTYEAIPVGMLVLHHCDNQGCVRPDHLYIGTHADNTRDATERNRWATGERQGLHRLTVEKVEAIRRDLAEGQLATEAIGAKYGISGRAVRYIRAGKRWTSHAA